METNNHTPQTATPPPDRPREARRRQGRPARAPRGPGARSSTSP